MRRLQRSTENEGAYDTSPARGQVRAMMESIGINDRRIFSEGAHPKEHRAEPGDHA